jgi:hypothetical protein
VLWDGTRIPATGALPAPNHQDLGTILIQPGSIQGKLRIHIEGLAAGTRILDGVLVVPSLASGERSYDLVLDTVRPPDADGDDVPDSIDNCLNLPNPAQGPCVLPEATDGGSDTIGADMRTDDAGSDASVKSEVLTGPDLGRIGDGLAANDGPDAPADAGSGTLGESGPEAIPDAPKNGSDVTDVLDTLPDLDRDMAADVSDANAMESDGVDSVRGPDGVACSEEGTCNKPLGTSCEKGSECATGYCVDSVCCQNHCDKSCQACNSAGICQPVKKADDVPECTGTMTCDNRGTCVAK